MDHPLPDTDHHPHDCPSDPYSNQIADHCFLESAFHFVGLEEEALEDEGKGEGADACCQYGEALGCLVEKGMEGEEEVGEEIVKPGARGPQVLDSAVES